MHVSKQSVVISASLLPRSFGEMSPVVSSMAEFGPTFWGVCTRQYSMRWLGISNTLSAVSTDRGLTRSFRALLSATYLCFRESHPSRWLRSSFSMRGGHLCRVPTSFALSCCALPSRMMTPGGPSSLNQMGWGLGSSTRSRLWFSFLCA